MQNKQREIIRYLIFGVSTTLVNWGVYAILVRGLHMDMTPGNAIAWCAAVLFAFITNKIWVFSSNSWKWKVLLREAVSFLGARIATGLIEIFLPQFLYALGLKQNLFGIKGFAAKVPVTVIVVVLNYVFSKLLVFRSQRNKNRTNES